MYLTAKHSGPRRYLGEFTTCPSTPSLHRTITGLEILDLGLVSYLSLCTCTHRIPSGFSNPAPRFLVGEVNTDRVIALSLVPQATDYQGYRRMLLPATQRVLFRPNYPTLFIDDKTRQDKRQTRSPSETEAPKAPIS